MRFTFSTLLDVLVQNMQLKGIAHNYEYFLTLVFPLQEKKGPSTDKEDFEKHLRGDESKFINSMI